MHFDYDLIFLKANDKEVMAFEISMTYNFRKHCFTFFMCHVF